MEAKPADRELKTRVRVKGKTPDPPASQERLAPVRWAVGGTKCDFKIGKQPFSIDKAERTLIWYKGKNFDRDGTFFYQGEMFVYQGEKFVIREKKFYGGK